VRRQAVHHQRVAAGVAQQRAVDLVADEVAAPLVRLVFLAHARPDIGVQDVRHLGSGSGVARDLDLRPGGPGGARMPGSGSYPAGHARAR